MLITGANSKPRLEYEIFRRLRDLIYSRCGITFPDVKMYLLEARVLKRLDDRGLKTFEDYCYYITYDRDRETEIKCLLNSIVTNETSFFRDIAQLESFAKGVIPAVMDDKKINGSAKSLRVWSAACSTGEEPYTVAMLLLEEGLHLKGWNIEIIGSDISDSVLKCAMSARYDRYALRNTPEHYLRKYFAPSGDDYALKRQAGELVKYRRINLIDPLETSAVRDVDIIFCRNVFIYFDDASKKKAVAHLYDSLAKGGYLIVGFSESLHSVTRLFKPVNIARSLVYRKT
jgi:chemotaxis protein methyltransferase CheR